MTEERVFEIAFMVEKAMVVMLVITFVYFLLVMGGYWPI